MFNPPSQIVNTLTTSPIASGSNESKVLKGPGAMPVHSNPSSKDAVFGIGRNAYRRTTSALRHNNGKAQPAYILKPFYNQNNNLKQSGKPIQSSASYSASSHIEAKKRNAIGQGSSVRNANDQLAFMKGDKNVVNSALAKVRNVGAAVGKKRGFFATQK